jgi:hypothetical protein
VSELDGTIEIARGFEEGLPVKLLSDLAANGVIEPLQLVRELVRTATLLNIASDPPGVESRVQVVYGKMFLTCHMERVSDSDTEAQYVCSIRTGSVESIPDGVPLNN